MGYKILLIDDNEDDQFFFQKMIDKSEIQAEITVVSDGLSGIDLIKKYQFDCIFLDYSLPYIDGLHLLRKIRSMGIDTPVIMLTGQKNEQMVVKLMQAGANDYISKNFLTPDAIRLSIENAEKLYKVQKEKLLAEEALKASEARLAEAQKIAHIGNWEYDFESKQFFLSDEAYRILGYTPDNFTPSLLKFSKQIHPDDIPIFIESFNRIRATSFYDLNIRFITQENSFRFLNMKGHLVRNKKGSRDKIINTIQDITLLKTALNETKKAEIRSKATTIVFTVAILIFLISEALLDPFIEAFAASLAISLSFKGGLALSLKPVELYLEKFMISRMR